MLFIWIGCPWDNVWLWCCGPVKLVTSLHKPQTRDTTTSVAPAATSMAIIRSSSSSSNSHISSSRSSSNIYINSSSSCNNNSISSSSSRNNSYIICNLKGLPHNYTSWSEKIALIYRNSVVLIFFPGLVMNTYTNFQKTPAPTVLATTRCN